MEVIRWEHHVIPVMIYCHRRSVCQYVYSHWHKELEISRLFEGEVEFFSGGKQRIIRDHGVSLSNSEAFNTRLPFFSIYVGYDQTGIILPLIERDCSRQHTEA